MDALLGFNGLTNAADQILEETLFENISDNCFPVFREFITTIAIPKGVKGITPIKTEFKIEDFQKGMRDWKESTSTLPSGRHLGHYRIQS